MAARTDPSHLRHIALPRVVQELSPKMRLFCKPADLPALMLELAELIIAE